MAAGPRRGTDGEHRGVGDAEAVDAEHAQVGSTTRPIAALPHRCTAVVRWAAIQASRARSLPSTSPPGSVRAPRPARRRSAARAEGVAQAAAVVFGAQVAVGDAVEVEHAAAVGLLERAHEVQVAAGTNGRVKSSTSTSPAGSAPASQFSAACAVGACGCGGGSAVRNGRKTAGWSDQPRPTSGRSSWHVDACGPQGVGRAEAGAQEDPRRADGARAQHDLARRDALTARELDPHRTAVLDQYPFDGRVGAHGGAARLHDPLRPEGEGAGEVGAGGVDAQAVAAVARHQPGAGRAARVLVRLGREAQRLRGGEEPLRARVQELPEGTSTGIGPSEAYWPSRSAMAYQYRRVG